MEMEMEMEEEGWSVGKGSRSDEEMEENSQVAGRRRSEGLGREVRGMGFVWCGPCAQWEWPGDRRCGAGGLRRPGRARKRRGRIWGREVGQGDGRWARARARATGLG